GAGQSLITVVEAAAIVQEARAPVRFVIAGDGPERSAVEAAARSVSPRYLVIEPTLPKNATRAFYNACDVCLLPLAPLPILSETVPSKLFEIMACERPLIGSVNGEAAQIINESGSGWVTPPGDAAALASAVMRMCAMPSSER